ncbi:hypothetical protein [Rhodocytophaga rosea]|uniref:hypothetical protein n=1 Tax=Rhodocytophaga rosea TaxID=2704465 RepID=UPI0018D9A506|nr:hypothetical protein [Rhodocytophaga rosea]
MNTDKNKKIPQDIILTAEQEEILDLYMNNLDNIFEEIKESEKMQVEIETLHLKRILST